MGDSSVTYQTYLKELKLAIFLDDDKPEEAIEIYTFHFTYESLVGEIGDEPIVKADISFGTKGSMIKWKNDIYKRTILLLRQIMQASTIVPNVCTRTDSSPNRNYLTLPSSGCSRLGSPP